jgi:hypothetical protein
MDKFEDYRGNLVQRGTLVAYNQSGDVVIGVVESVKVTPYKNDTWNRSEYLIKVKKIGKTGWGDGNTSTIENHRCIVSIEKKG